MDVPRFILCLDTSIWKSSNMERREYLVVEETVSFQFANTFSDSSVIPFLFTCPQAALKAARESNDGRNGDIKHELEVMILPINQHMVAFIGFYMVLYLTLHPCTK